MLRLIHYVAIQIFGAFSDDRQFVRVMTWLFFISAASSFGRFLSIHVIHPPTIMSVLTPLLIMSTEIWVVVLIRTRSFPIWLASISLVADSVYVIVTSRKIYEDFYISADVNEASIFISGLGLFAIYRYSQRRI